MDKSNKNHSEVCADDKPLSEHKLLLANPAWEDGDKSCLNDDLSFVTDAIYSALLDPSPYDGNQYWRGEPRTLLAFQLLQLTDVDK